MPPPSSEIVVEAAGRQLAARLFGDDGRAASGRGILFIHGLHSDQAGYQPRAEEATLKLGATCLTFDLGGHGRSGTQPEVLSARDHLLDTIAAYDALVASQHVDPARVGVCGASYGAYLAALIVAQRPVRRLLLRAPALYPDDWLDTPIGRRGPLGTTPTNSAALESLRQFGGEVLVLESGCDEAIPKDMIQAYLHACRSPVHDLIPEATHQLTDPLWKELFLQRIVEWFGPL